MNLNRQLLCVSLILLCLPWAGCQYLREMDGILRSSQEQALLASTSAIAAAFSHQAGLLYPQGDFYLDSEHQTRPLYFHPLPARLWIDGYSEGWENIIADEYRNPDNPQQRVQYRAGIKQQQLHLFFEISDEHIVYNNPAKSLIDHGDRLVLATGTGIQYVLTTAAPGIITVRYRNKAGQIYRESSISAYWQDTAQGFNLEIAMPAQLAAGRLGFYIINQQQAIETRYGPLAKAHEKSPPLYIYQPPELKEQLEIFQQPGQRLKIVDPKYWLLSQQGNLNHDQPSSSHWLIKKLYRHLLGSRRENKTEFSDSANHSSRPEVTAALSGNASSIWYRDHSRPNHFILASAAAITQQGSVVGVVITEQSSEKLAALSDSAFNRLLLFSGGAITLVVIALLGYASWLSWRIRRLSRAATQLVSTDGKLSGNFPVSAATDEIGELSRNYAQLLNRIQDYTDYLQTFSRKLTHELRTPLAIIHSSLDNLFNQPLDQQSSVYQQRAKEGATRLGNILTAMSEASRVEESIEHAELEMVDMSALLSGVTRAYQDLYQQHNIHFMKQETANTGNHPFLAVPDLLVQMLDKLVDNAISFCPAHGNIELVYARNNNSITISVSNDGPLLPEHMRSQLFDNMVSLRDSSQGGTHLGLGLYIVYLIVQLHNGRIIADNKKDNSGVIFTIVLPV